MATIRKLRGRWQAQVRRRGMKPRCKSFVWLNLELIKKPPQCLEYVIVHELTHFFERRHSEYFVELLDRRLPNWRIARDELNSQPLGHEEW